MVRLLSSLLFIGLASAAFGQESPCEQCGKVLEGGVFNLYAETSEWNFHSESRRLLDMSKDDILVEISKGGKSGSFASKIFSLGGGKEWNNESKHIVREKTKLDDWQNLEMNSRSETFQQLASQTILDAWLSCIREKCTSIDPHVRVSKKVFDSEVQIRIVWNGPIAMHPKVTALHIGGGELLPPIVLQEGLELTNSEVIQAVARRHDQALSIVLNTDCAGAWADVTPSTDSVYENRIKELEVTWQACDAALHQGQTELADCKTRLAAKEAELAAWESSWIELHCFDDLGYTGEEFKQGERLGALSKDPNGRMVIQWANFDTVTGTGGPHSHPNNRVSSAYIVIR